MRCGVASGPLVSRGRNSDQGRLPPWPYSPPCISDRDGSGEDGHGGDDVMMLTMTSCDRRPRCHDVITTTTMRS